MELAIDHTTRGPGFSLVCRSRWVFWVLPIDFIHRVNPLHLDKSEPLVNKALLQRYPRELLRVHGNVATDKCAVHFSGI